MTDRPPFSLALRREQRSWLSCAVFAAILALFWTFAGHDGKQGLLYGFVAAMFLTGYGVAVGLGSGYEDGYRGGLHDGVEGELAKARARERELAELLAACNLNIEDTVPDEDEGYIYVLKFSTGTVKPGQTRNLRRRFAEHRRAAEAYNVAICDYWVSQPHTNYLDNELQLIAFCDEMASRSKREYFHGLDFDKAVEFALGLPFHVADPAMEVVPS